MNLCLLYFLNMVDFVIWDKYNIVRILLSLIQRGVVMDIETYNRREKMLKLRKEPLAVEEDRRHGSKGYSVCEVAEMMRSAIKETVGHETTE